jgi:hypothetical protein
VLKIGIVKHIDIILVDVNSKMNENKLADVYFKKALALFDSVKREIWKGLLDPGLDPFSFRLAFLLVVSVRTSGISDRTHKPSLAFDKYSYHYSSDRYSNISPG